MNHQPHYFRRPDHLYRLVAHPTYSFEAGQCRNTQLLWGLGSFDAIVIEFSLTGALLGTARNAFPTKPHTATELEASYHAYTHTLRRSRGVNGAAIRVLRFWIPELQVGIDDLPDSLAEFVDAPHTFDPEETKEYRESLHSWRRSSKYAFWWGAEFEVNGWGHVFGS